MQSFARFPRFTGRVHFALHFAVIVAAGMSAVWAVEDDESLTPEELVAVRQAEAERIQAIERVYGAVVAIYGNDRQGGGSGVIYDECGLALTNHHVIAAAGSQGWGGLADGKLYRWKLIGTDPGGDVAIIQLTGRDTFPAAPLGDSDKVQVGDWAMAMGNPFILAEDQRPTVTLGIVSGVKRYQPGAGLNTLVYGNCIQIDSSINPGNSGGPLFNLRGEVIGINGRGSFQERGRVNVGLGYAISCNQIKNFIPDLLATKIAQHGTLDAVFADRDGKVVCETINLDSAAAKLGLQLGDRLVEFEGRKIQSANQFTNLISTLPADWPAQLVYEHDGRETEMWVRLYPLPYQFAQQPQPMPQPMPQPEEKKDQPDAEDREEKESSADEGDDQPDDVGDEQPSGDSTPPDGKKSENDEQPEEGKDEPPRPKIEIPIRPGFEMTKPGAIRDESINRDNSERILRRWKQSTASASGDSPLRFLRVTDQMLQGHQAVGEQVILLAGDGRFRLEQSDRGRTVVYGFDGKNFWTTNPADDGPNLPRAKALLNPFVAQLATIAAALHEQPLSDFGEVSLDGGDKAQNQIAYRLKTLDANGDWFYVWLSVFDERQQHQQVRLLKSGPDVDGEGRSGAVIYGGWQTVEGFAWPSRRAIVSGLAERVEIELVSTNITTVELAKDASDISFSSPKSADKQ